MESCVTSQSYRCNGEYQHSDNIKWYADGVLLWMFCPEILNLPLTLRLHLWVLALPISVHLLRNAGSIEDEMKLLQNKKLTERQRAAAQLRFSEKVILQKTLDAVRRWFCLLNTCLRGGGGLWLCT